jgi:NAD(P)-dependent dehydrogenase (short-subunit alcohol dehydrogenase family)
MLPQRRNAHCFTAGYNSSKEALRALTRTAVAKWGRHGITCNIICPIAVTGPWEQYLEMLPEEAQKILDMNPIGRLEDSERDIGLSRYFWPRMRRTTEALHSVSPGPLRHYVICMRGDLG